MPDILETSAQYIKGVGPQKFKLLNKLGIKTVRDLLFYFPRRHEDRSKFLPISQIKSGPGQFHTIKGVIRSMGIFRTKTGLTIFQLAVSDGTGTVYAIWFNQPYLKKYFRIEDKIILYGRLDVRKRLQLNVPEYEIISEADDSSVHIGRIAPIYPLAESVRQRMLRSIAYLCVENFSSRINDPMPSHIKLNKRLIELKFAIKHIHFPKTFTTLENAKRRLIFDEFFFLQLALARKKAKLKFNTEGMAHNLEGGLIKIFEGSLPFELTDAQKRATEQIKKDLASKRPMHRLLQGDVGSGKTIVAMHALIIAMQSGCQAAVMCPTEILAQQHYSNISEMLSGLGIKIAILTSGANKKEKTKIKQMLESGEMDIIVGTHALIEEDVGFKRLSLVIVDEQHKFGVAQRLVLTQKGINPDILIMTATPIPRTLGLTVYGDLDISVIDQMPPGRIPVETFLFGEEDRQKVYDFMRGEIKKGRQVFVVYPLVDETVVETRLIASLQKDEFDTEGQKVFKISRIRLLNLKAATKMYEDFKNTVFADLRVGLVHGRMKPDEKQRVLSDFRQGFLDILVSTIVVEVGIDMPNASCMVVEHAERFGLSQLHQLRGRIGRSIHQSYCILLADAKTESAKMRLSSMLESNDGFKIAERDLEIRGPGDLMGTRQSGIPEFKLANIVRDVEILQEARQEAFGLVRDDPGLSKFENRFLRFELEKRFPEMEQAGL